MYIITKEKLCSNKIENSALINFDIETVLIENTSKKKVVTGFFFFAKNCFTERLNIVHNELNIRLKRSKKNF